MLGSKFVKFLLSISNWQVNSSSNFVSFFIVMTHNSSVKFKLIHFILRIKASHQSPNFETFKCSGGNLPNSSCHFWMHKSVFLQILDQSSVPSNITPLYVFCSNIIYFGQSSPLNCKLLRFSSVQVKIHWNPHVLNWQVNSSSNFASFFIVIIHNSLVIFKLTHFLLWIKGSHQSPNFENFGVLWWMFAKFLMSFFKPQVRFYQILHHFPFSLKITPVYFFRSNVIYFAQRRPVKAEII